MCLQQLVFLRHLEYLTTTADEQKTSSRIQSFHKRGVLGSSMLLSRESGAQPKHYIYASIACKTPQGQHTGMIQLGRHGAELVESGVYFFAYKSLSFRNRCTTLKTNVIRYYLQVKMLKKVHLFYLKNIEMFSYYCSSL